MRLIDADALKEYIDIQKDRLFTGCTIGEALKIMTDEQLTIEERKWIPCSERLPETYGYCLATVYDGHTRRVSYIQFSKREQAWILTGRQAYWKVIAWQPLPEPYREVGHD